LFRDIPGARTGYFNPRLGEEGTCREHEGDINSGVDGVEDGFLNGMRRRHIVRNTRNGPELRGIFKRLEKDVSPSSAKKSGLHIPPKYRAS
jgi:hypothetical protein